MSFLNLNSAHDPIARLRPRRRLSLRDVLVGLTVGAIVMAMARWEAGLWRLHGYLFTTTTAIIGGAFLWGWWTRRWGWPLVISCAAIAFMITWPGVSDPRSLSRQHQSANNLQQITRALYFYEREHGSLPPAYLTDAEGRPIHSWRVLLLPYLEEHALYKQYNFAEPWDSPNNLKVAAQMPAVYGYPADRLSTQFTPYVVVVDDESLFPGALGVKLDEIEDGTSRTLAVLEWPESNIVWTEPRDLDLPSLHYITHPPRASLTGRRRHPGGRTSFALADGSTRVLPLHESSVAEFRELITRAGGDRHELLNE